MRAERKRIAVKVPELLWVWSELETPLKRPHTTGKYLIEAIVSEHATQE